MPVRGRARRISDQRKGSDANGRGAGLASPWCDDPGFGANDKFVTREHALKARERLRVMLARPLELLYVPERRRSDNAMTESGRAQEDLASPLATPSNPALGTTLSLLEETGSCTPGWPDCLSEARLDAEREAEADNREDQERGAHCP